MPTPSLVQPQPAQMLTSQRELRSVLLEIAPAQGCWSDGDYLWLSERSNRLIELTDGWIEVLPPPSEIHQSVLLVIYRWFFTYLTPLGGRVYVAPLRLRLRTGKFREPDLLLIRQANDPRRQNRYWLGADLVLEVVSPDQPDRDLIVKRADYAEAGIPEYWIVDPARRSVVVLQLAHGQYVSHGEFGPTESATSANLAGLSIPLDAIFADIEP